MGYFYFDDLGYVTTGGNSYRFEVREKQLSLGRYPYVPVESAWARRHAARHFLEAGVDPGSQKQALRRIFVDSL